MKPERRAELAFTRASWVDTEPSCGREARMMVPVVVALIDELLANDASATQALDAADRTIAELRGLCGRAVPWLPKGDCHDLIALLTAAAKDKP